MKKIALEKPPIPQTLLSEVQHDTPPQQDKATPAQPLIGPTAPSAAKAPSVDNKSGTYIAPANKAIESMQLEMIEIINETAKTNGTPLVGPEFIKYIVGKADPNATEQQLPTKFAEIMAAMRNIGHEGHPAPDGIWGPKTNASLNSLYNYAANLLELAKVKQNKIQYTDSDLAEFRQLVPSDDSFTEQQKVETAPKITEALKKLHNLYNKVAEQNLYKVAPQETANAPTQARDLSPQELSDLKMHYPAGWSLGNNLIIQVTDFVDKEAFHNWFVKNQAVLPQNMTEIAVLENIASQLGAK
jgi:hypothetical protein